MNPPSGRTFVAAYRFQLTPEDDFGVASRLVPYLRTIGISHLYLSPIAEAELGSRHGYDITDPTRVRDELGGAEALDQLCIELERHGLGLIIDIVPNHLSIATPERNPWFWDVLRHGRASEHADAFDIDWDGADGKVVLPVLTQQLNDELRCLTPSDADDGPVIELSTGLRLPVSVAIDGMQPPAIGEVLEAQPYRLVPWQSTERNQRRFFEIDSLAGVAVESERVRLARHALLAELLERWPHVIDGVRVDHVDGLADPDDYLTWLRHFIGDGRLLLVEKILVGDETLPDRWPIDGTTGYEFARLVDRLLVDGDGWDRMRALWARATGDERRYEVIEHEAIDEVLRDRLRPEVERIQRCVQHDPSLTLSGEQGAEATVALTAALGRYRTYLPSGGDDDVAVIRAAADRAIADAPALATPIAALVSILTTPTDDDDRQAQTLFQQLTGPALAKGGEDRALYRYLPLAAMNEVGGDPGGRPASTADFHRWAIETQDRHPRTLLTTSTHDTKRSGDVRARLLALSHKPDIWASFVGTWLPKLDLHPADGLLLLQSAIGAWPIDRERLTDYLIKAVREGAERSSWIEPDTDYEATLAATAASCLDNAAFRAAIEALLETIEERAQAGSLIHALLRLTAPGVGDLYRGDEVRDLSLVDPDNRRPLDWSRLAAVSADSTEHDVPSAWEVSFDLAKMTLIRRTLASRQAQGSPLDYEPLATGNGRILAYRRGNMVVVTVPGTWPTEEASILLPDGEWHDALRDGRPMVSGRVGLRQLADPRLPLALLTHAGQLGRTTGRSSANSRAASG